jgi:hypothetical protein
MKDLFFQITKVDEEKRLVTGQACAETPDLSGEIFDYETSKPLFEAWSAKVAADTDGKSFGNVRSMHSNVAAGKVAQPLGFDDANKAINVAVKVVDDNEWEKVLEGVHTGFSIGGSYVNKWKDADDAKLTRYTANPSEISLVDRPCVPTAKFFDVVKADGSVLRKAFKEKEMEHEQAVTVDQLTDEMAAMLKAGDLNEGDMLAAIKKALEDKRLDDLAFGKKDYSDDERSKMAGSGEALPDGSFPIKDGKDLHNAVQAFGRAKDPEKAKAHIKSRAESLGMSDQLPDDWKEGEAEKVAKAAAVATAAQITTASATSTSEMPSAQPGQADNMTANMPTGENATVTPLEAPAVGAMVQFTFGEASFQGKLTAISSEGAEVETSTGCYVATKPSFSQGEPGSGVDFAMTGEMSRKALTTADLSKAAVVALRKGMYGVSSFASILGSIHCLQQDTEWEAAYEADGSDMPNKIKAWMSEGCDLLRAMVEEECRELVADPDGDGAVDAYSIMLAAPAGEMAKSAAMASAIMLKVAQGPDELKKFAERVDVAKALQGKVDRLGADLEKQAGEAASLRKQLKAGEEELGKVAKERDEAVAKAHKMEAERKAPSVMSVPKGADVLDGGSAANKVEPVKDSFGKVDEAATALKMSLRSPIRVVNP